MPTVTSTCPMDCPDTCALEVEVAAGPASSDVGYRNGDETSGEETSGDDVPRVVRIGGAAGHPTTQGFICGKVSRFHERLDHPDRLLRPLRRVGRKGEGRFEPISWDEALGEVVERLEGVRRRWGGEAILPFHYGGSNGLLSDELIDDLLFARLGASRLAKTICAAPSTAVARGMYGKMPGVAYEDYPEARCIVVWGANPKTSGIHLVPFLHRARRRGAFVAAVDPRRTFSDNEADLQLQILPGSDLPVALALIDRYRRQGLLDRAFLTAHADGLEPLLEAAADWPLGRAAAEAGVAEDDLARLADAYAEASPALIRTGWGLERNANGGRALAAILALPALLGKFGVRGGGYTMSNSGAHALDRRAVLGELDWNTRIVNMTRLGAWLTAGHGGNGGPRAAETPDADTAAGDPSFPPDPPIRALFVYNANPAASVPDQRAVLAGLAREELFTVVFDQVMTDTARWADVVLPATTFLEHWDLRASYGAYGIGGIRPAVPRRGEARPNLEVFAELGRRLGFTDEPFSWDERTAFGKVAAALTFTGRPVDGDRLAAGLWTAPDFPGPTPVQMGTVHPATADGRIHLTPAVLGEEPFAYRPRRDPRHPLALISPASRRMITSSMGEYDEADLVVTLHPDDAADRGIGSGAAVRVYNDLGEVRCAARVSGWMRRGVVEIPKGAWLATSANGATATALCPTHLNRVGAGACFNDARVEVEPLPAG